MDDLLSNKNNIPIKKTQRAEKNMISLPAVDCCRNRIKEVCRPTVLSGNFQPHR